VGVKVRKRRRKWYVVIDYHGHRKSKCVGTREAAEKVKREVEARLALGDLSVLSEPGSAETFKKYAERWLQSHAKVRCKPSTYESYEQVLRIHLFPRFGSIPLIGITRNAAKTYLSEVAASGEYAYGTLKNILATLRAVLSHGVEDEVLPSNPAIRLGKFFLPGAQRRKPEFLTQTEATAFLDAAKAQRPHRYPFFLAALRTGMRMGELLALEWDDIQFGESEDDANRFILVRRNYVRGKFVSPKSGKQRRVDLTKELRRVLLKLRDEKLLAAFKAGKEGISGLVFPSDAGGPMDGVNLYHRDFLPCLKAAHLRSVTFHSLRHTYASLLIQRGASLAYVKEQMGHSSIQVTVDIYGHLIPGANIAWADALDTTTSPQQSATQPQTDSPTKEAPSKEAQEIVGMPKLVGGPTRTRTWDQRIMSPLL
jgi:integrase